MTHPFTILETYGTDTGWDDNSMLAIACDFIQFQAINHPDLLAAFQAYVSQRAAEEEEAATESAMNCRGLRYRGATQRWATLPCLPRTICHGGLSR